MSKKIIPKDEYGRPTLCYFGNTPKGRIDYDTNDPDDKGYISLHVGYDLDKRVSREKVLRHLEGMIVWDSMTRPDEKICEFEWMEMCRHAYDEFQPKPWNSR